MIDTGKLYQKYSIPLKEVESPKEGEIYYNMEGHALKYKGNNTYEFIEGSPLRIGNVLPKLTELQLDLFWKLVKNKNLNLINFK